VIMPIAIVITRIATMITKGITLGRA